MAHATIEAELASFINCLSSIGEPYLGTNKNYVDLLCKSIEAAARRMPLTSMAPSRTALRCKQARPPWLDFLMDKIQGFINRNSGIVTPFDWRVTQSTIIAAQRSGRKLGQSEIFNAIQLLIKDFKILCASVHGLQHLCDSSPSPEKAKNALDHVKLQYSVTMQDFKFLRAGLPKEVDDHLHWRGTP